MTDETIILIEKILRERPKVDYDLLAVADAIERYRRSGDPKDEQRTHATAWAYLGYLKE